MKIIVSHKIMAVLVYGLLFLDNLIATSDEEFNILFIDTNKTINLIVYLSLTTFMLYSLFRPKKHE